MPRLEASGYPEDTSGSPPPPSDWRSALKAGAPTFGVELSESQLDAYGAYLAELLEWNRRVNLTSITDPAQVAALHFLDSLTCLSAARFDANMCVLDVGSGAGLPGIALAIARPDLEIVLLESVCKKCRFLEQAIVKLALTNVAVDCRRAETAARDSSLRESFDVVVTRAVAEVATAVELCLPFARIGGIALLMKGPKATEELDNARSAIGLLGGTVEFIRELTFPTPSGEAQRAIIGVRKIASTPVQYPRAPGRPAKRPLR